MNFSERCIQVSFLNCVVIGTIHRIKSILLVSDEENLLPYHIPNMMGYGEYKGKRSIVLDLLGDDFMQLIADNECHGPQSYEAVCFWAKQMVTIPQSIESPKVLTFILFPQ